MVYKSFDKKSAGSGIVNSNDNNNNSNNNNNNNNIKQNLQLPENDINQLLENFKKGRFIPDL